MFRIEDYDYELPEELVAQVPAADRDGSRLLAVNRLERSFSDHYFRDLFQILEPDDLLVVNNTKVIPARLFGRKDSGGRFEILVLGESHENAIEPNTRWCLFRSSKRPKVGSSLFFENGVRGRIEALGEDGMVEIRFQGAPSVNAMLEAKGDIPLPPYIKREMGDDRRLLDMERYQTIFSKIKGAVAAPTAGLHFTPDLVRKLHRRGISLAEVTLHVGPGTFRPVRTSDIRKHRLGEEEYLISPETSEAVREAKTKRGRIIAVGTTVVRALETAIRIRGEIVPIQGKTDLLITPGFEFRAVDGIITNFHLPRSSLLFLVSAFGGYDLLREAYRQAIQKGYRFYSYGDAMVIL